MKKFSLTAIARAELREASTSSNGRAARTVFGGHEHTLRQTVIALAAGTELQERQACQDDEDDGDPDLEPLAAPARHPDQSVGKPDQDESHEQQRDDEHA